MTRSVLLAALALLLGPTAARAEVVIAEGTPILGHVHLVAEGDVRIVEDVDGVDFQAPTSRTPDGVETALQWTCRTRRTFAAIAGDERSTPLTVTTPRCEDRLKVSARPDVGVGDDLRISVVDRWSLGNLTADVCVTPPGGDPRCAGVELPPDQDIAHAVFRASVAGRWRIVATTPIGTFERSVTIVRHHYPRGGPTVLFTGDSMMLATRHVLQRRLPRTARMIDDIYVGSGITRPFAIDWAKLPGRQVHAYRPDATVISLGMSDGRAIKDVRCCGTDWIAAYARRVRTLMRTYTRNGDGAVVWLNVPFSRNPDRWPQEAAVNAAVALAAHGRTRVQVVDLASAMTPDGVFARDLVRDGERVRIRTSDGIHLTPAGARIAARLAMARLRRLGVIGSAR